MYFEMQINEDENVRILMSMGFYNVQDNKRALELSHNDISEAVCYLTGEYPGLIDLTVAESACITDANDNKNNRKMDVDNSESQHFPVAHFLDLESRVLSTNFHVPFTQFESLEKCLNAAKRLAKDGLLESDSDCSRFVDVCFLKPCLDKLLTVQGVNRMNVDTLENIFHILQSFIDLVCFRLAFDPVPSSLFDCLSLVLDPQTIFNTKNYRKKLDKVRFEVELGLDLVDYAINSSVDPQSEFVHEPCGYLVDLIDRFGVRGGFDIICQKFCHEAKISFSEMDQLFKPFAICVDFLNRPVVGRVFCKCISFALQKVEEILNTDSALQSENPESIITLLAYCKIIALHLLRDEALGLKSETLQFKIILSLIKSTNYGCRMLALKTLTKFTECINSPIKLEERLSIAAEKLTKWLSDNSVLSLALEGSIDQSQYCDRLRNLFLFMGPNLSNNDLSRIWSVRRGKAAATVENVYSIIAQTASKLGQEQFDYLLVLIKDSWEVESDRNREKLAALLCKIGQEADHYVYCFEKAAELLWMLSHQVGLPTTLLNACLELHLSIVGVSSRVHLAKEYVNKCFEDIQEGSFAYLATSHLLKMLQTIKTTSGSNKAHKAILENLINKKSLIEALCNTLDRASEEVSGFFLQVQENVDDMIVDTPPATTVKDKSFDADIVLQSGHTYKQHVDQVLNFLRFALTEGNMYLTSSKCIELWNTLIVKSSGINYAQDACFNFFLNGSDDIDDADTPEVFKKCIEPLKPDQFTPLGFCCFEKYFIRSNVFLKKLRNSQSADSLEVDDLNLIGLGKLRLIALNCSDSLVAEKAMQLLISINYDWPSDRLRQKYREQKLDLDLKFLGSLKTDLLGFLSQLKNGEDTEAVIVRNIIRILQIIRFFLRDTRKTSALYCPSHCAPTIIPHGASFCSKLIILDVELDDLSKIKNEAEKANDGVTALKFIADLNEMLGCLKERLVAAFQLDLGAVSFHTDNEELEYSLDFNILRSVFAKFIPNEARNFDCSDGILETNIKIVIKQRSKSIFTRLTPRKSSIGDNGFMSRPSSSCCISPRLNDYEKVVQALHQDKGAVQLLFELADLDNVVITDHCRLLLLDLPTDQRLLERIDNLAYIASASIVPDVNTSSKFNFDHLSSVFECSRPFQMLYSLETLSSRLLPLPQSEWVSLRHGTLNFTKQLVNSHPIINFLTFIMENNVGTNDSSIRHNIYSIIIQLLRFLLCQRSNLHLILENQRENVVKFYKSGIASINGANSHTSLLNPSPTPITPLNSVPTDQLFWLTLHIDDKSNKFLSTLNHQRLDELVEVLRYLTWSGTGTRLISNNRQVPLMSREISNLMDAVSGRISESSVDSTSDSEAVGSFLKIPMKLSKSDKSSIPEIETACESFVLLIDLLLRCQEYIKPFVGMKLFRKFLLDCLLIVPNRHLRQTIRVHFLRLVKSSDSRLTLSATYLNEELASASTLKDSTKAGGSSCEDSLVVILFNILQKSPVPLWGSTFKARSTAQRLFAQCEEFFGLKNELLRSMSPEERFRIDPSLVQMLELEIDWLSNFSCECSRSGLNSQETNRFILEVAPLLTGHLKNIEVLLELLPVKFKEEYGAKLIKLLIEDFLFPSSQAVLRSKNGQGYDVRLIDSNSAIGSSKCKTVENRLAAYDLVLELSRNCFKSYENITKILLNLNHQWSSDLNAEYEYAPLIDTKDTNFGFVGLKNASATCYMNAILQQFFMEPGLIDSFLPIDISTPLFKEIQRLFGHLKLSRQKFYEPKNFWGIFQFFGRAVNVREQQDAFEFYTCLIDQLDELLKSNDQQQIFKMRYQGAFSDQKICQGCPHRYEKDESFYSLNLPIKGHNLEEALNNFVKGELLEGDNAYLCELCNEKRTTVKRTCIKKCPPVIAIQLKRFYFDYNENRIVKSNDKFEFPFEIDLYPYTISAVSKFDEFPTNMDRRFSTPMNNLSDVSRFLNSPNTKSTIDFCDSAPTSMCQRAKTHLTPGENSSKIDESAIFELVGVVVHSGQASAGHYYSFIRDRRPEANENGTKNKWFKFNDTTVEQVDMTPEFVEHELFGGNYKASTDKHSSFPEDRVRYWNAYMLFYSRVDSCSKDSKSTRMTSKRSVSVCSPSGVSPRTKNARRHDSLVELAELVKQGEEMNLFTLSENDPPTWLLSEICEENLKFLRNVDIYNNNYLQFIASLCQLGLEYDIEKFAPAALIFCLSYLFKTAWHCRKEFRCTSNKVNVFGNFLTAFCTKLENISAENTKSIVYHKIFDFLKHNLQYCKEFLLLCTESDIRNDFADFLSRILSQSFKHDCPEARDVTKFLLELISVEAKVQYQNSSTLFVVFKGLSGDQSSTEGAKFLLENGVCSSIMDLLLITSQPKTPEMIEVHAPKNSPPVLINGDQSPEIISPVSSMIGLRNYSRRFSSNQARGFKNIYCLLSDLIVRCKLDNCMANGNELIGVKKQEITHTTESSNLFVAPPPDLLKFIKNTDLFHDFVKEMLWAYRHVEGCSTHVEDVLLYLAWSNDDLCRIIVFETLLVCQVVQYREFKTMLPLLCRMLTADQEDTFRKRVLYLPPSRKEAQATLVQYFLDGVHRQSGDEPFDIKGLLYAVKSNHQNDDGRRAYACVKLLSNASTKCPLVKIALNQRQDDWLWAVQWLREKMTEASGGSKIDETGVRKSLRLRGAGGGAMTTNIAASTSRQLFTSNKKPNAALLPANVSNDDVLSTSFRRTVSAQITLDEAEALLSEMTTTGGTTLTPPLPPSTPSPIDVPEASNFVVVEMVPRSSKILTEVTSDCVSSTTHTGMKKDDGKVKSPEFEKSTMTAHKPSPAKFF